MLPWTIEMHFKETMALAEQLKNLSRAVKDVSENQIMQTAYQIKTDWNSECADIILGKEVKLVAGLLKESDTLNRIAEEIEGQARELYQAELLGAQLARTRIY